ncbi:MAG: DUF4440 domain-containing protein [Flavobacteriales bacterium]|nr:DUF4440 domain-containing protein [Flavobacteriales bacterium]
MTRSTAFPTLLAAAALALCGTACNTAPAPAESAPPPPDVGAITAAITDMEEVYAKAAANKDVETIMAYYAEDIVSYRTGKEALQGKAALRAEMAERMEQDSLNVVPVFKVQDIFVGLDHVTEIGSWTDSDAQGNVLDHGTYMAVFRKTANGWECIREMSVSAKAKEAAATAS